MLVDHEAFEAQLRRLYVEKSGERRHVRLPSSRGMTVSGTERHATLRLSAKAVVSNMQTPAAAFEGWRFR